MERPVGRGDLALERTVRRGPLVAGKKQEERGMRNQVESGDLHPQSTTYIELSYLIYCELHIPSLY